MATDRIIRIGCAVLLAAVAGLALAASSALARKHAAKLPSCNALGGIERNTGPVALPGSLDPGITGAYALLRRPQGPIDQLPPLNPVEAAVEFQLGSYFPSDIRRLASLPGGHPYFLIAGFRREYPEPPARCLPPSLRSLHQKLAEEGHRRALEPTYCIVDVASRAGLFGPSADCVPFRALATGATLLASELSKTPVVDLAPDGVATVRLSYRNGTSITAAVSENGYTFKPPAGLVRNAETALNRPPAALRELYGHGHLRPSERRHYERQLEKEFARIYAQAAPRNVEWLDAGGRLLRSFAPAGGPRATVIGTNETTSSSGEGHALLESISPAPSAPVG